MERASQTQLEFGPTVEYDEKNEPPHYYEDPKPKAKDPYPYFEQVDRPDAYPGDIIKMTPDLLRQARARGAQVASTHDPYIITETGKYPPDTKRQNTVGAIIEIAFSIWSGLPRHTENIPTGDENLDFCYYRRGLQYLIDTKGANFPKFVLLESDKTEKAAHYIVVGQWKAEHNEVWLLGWEHRDVMIQMPTRNFSDEINSHFADAAKIRKMIELRELLLLRDKHAPPGMPDRPCRDFERQMRLW